VANSGLVLGGGTLRVNTGAVANTQNFTGTTISSGSSRVEIVDNGGPGIINLGAITRTAGGTVDVGVVGTVNTTNTNVNGILGKGVTVNGSDWAKNDGTGKIVAAAGADYSATFGATNNLDVTAPITGGGAVNSIKATANITLDANTTVASGGILIPSTAGNVTIASTAGETLTSGNNLDLIVIQNSAAGIATIGSKITGAIGLTKSGVGTLVLGNVANDYTGGTFINAGTLVISTDSALGNVNGGLTLAASSLSTAGVLAVTDTMTLASTRAVTLNSGAGGFSVPATKTLTINQPISGAGGLGKLGAGTLVLGGTNTYTGDTVIFEGSLTMNGTIASAGGFIADGNVTLGTGGAIASAGAVQIARNAGPSVVVTGNAATISGGEFTIGGAGNASVTLTGASTLSASCDLFVARLNGSTSSLNVTGGAVIAQHAMLIGAAGGANGTATVADGSLAVGGGLYVGNAGGTGVLNLTGTTIGSYGFLEVGNGGAGTLNIADSATLRGSTAVNNGYINVGNNNSGQAVVNQSGGEVNFNSWMTIGISGGSNDPSNSQYNISGGTLAGAGIEVGADHGGTLSVSGTGAVNVPSIEVGTHGDRGTGTAGNGVLNVSGGTLTSNALEVGKNRNNGGMTSNGVLNLTGGVTTVNGNLVLAVNGGGGGSTGTANLGGGELKVNGIARGAGATAQLNFNGTVIKPNAANGNFITGFDASSTDVQAGGAIFNTDGKNIGVSTQLDGVGALTKAGNGKLTLSGDSSYAGGVNLDAGTLAVRHNNALGTGTIIGNGGVLAFDNSGGAGLIEGRLAGAFNTGDAIPFDAVQLGTPKANTTNAAEFGDNTTWGYRGSLVVPAGPDVTWTFSKQFDDSMRLLIDGNQLINDGTWNAAVVATVVLPAGEHTIELRAGQGGGGVGPNNGWTVGFGIDTQGRNTANPSFFTPLTDPGDGSRLRYTDGGNAEYTVANAATLNVQTEVFVKQYGATLTGDIAGVAGINKTGNGRLTLTGTNSYAGTTNIAAGVLEIGNGGATGSLGSGNVTNSGTLKFNRTGTLTVPGNISGTGPVEHNGTGTTILGGANTYTGATTVNAGNLQVAGSISGSVVTVQAAGTLSGTGTVGTVIVNGGNVAPGASLGILNSGDITFNGGTLSIEINGTAVGSLYDQLNVTGAVALQSNVALALNFGFGAVGGETFTIINNDGSDAIGGAGLLTFASVPLNDGDLFSDFGNGLSLQIDYNGGTNSNDVVLTVVPEPGSLVMVMGGLAILAGVRRRRK
jgi:fibronectin-binding autotransporter adhesin